mgnify:CR=1 FL=1
MKTLYSIFLSIVTIHSTVAIASSSTPTQQLSYWTTQAGINPQIKNGEAFFTNKHGKEWSCSSCHGNPPVSAGKHASTNKTIPPLAPISNPDALTDSAKTDKWFKRNCNDVLGRECTSQEKAEVLAYLINLKK